MLVLVGVCLVYFDTNLGGFNVLFFELSLGSYLLNLFLLGQNLRLHKLIAVKFFFACAISFIVFIFGVSDTLVEFQNR